MLTQTSPARPGYEKIEQLIAHGMARHVQLYAKPDDPAPWTHRLGATSGTSGQAAYDIVVHVDPSDELGLEQPYLVHCDCQAGTYGKPCSHAALALRRLNLHLPWAQWLFLDADHYVQGPEALRQSLREEQPID